MYLICKIMSFDKVKRLQAVYKALDALTLFTRPALPFINSHLTEFYTENYWESLLPKSLRDDLESKSVEEVKTGLKDAVNGNWKTYANSSPTGYLTFDTIKTFQDVIVATARVQLSEICLSTPVTKLCFNGVQIYETSTPAENGLQFDTIMSAKKTHEVVIMSDFIKKISESALGSGNEVGKEKVEYLVDVGSGKGYLSSYLTLLHQFKLLAVDSSSVNTDGCERRSAKLEKVWAQLVRRAVERQTYGECSKRGKHWKSKKQIVHDSAHDISAISASGDDGINDEKTAGDSVDRSPDLTITRNRSSEQTQTTSNNDSDNKLLKTLTQFVTPDVDLTKSIRDNFSTITTTTTNTSDHLFGLVGLHTCGNLGVASLRLFISNENAKFICNVPCCFHLLDENHLFYPSRKFHGSKIVEKERRGDSKTSNDLVECILKPSFPISRKLDVDDSSRFCLGRNARMMSAYSLPKMVSTEKGLDLHPSIFYRSVLEVIIKNAVGEDYLKNESEHSVGKIGDKCKTFVEYVRMGLKNLKLDSQVQPFSDGEIDDVYAAYVRQGKDRLLKYYLLRSLFASVVEAIILLDRLAFLLEQDEVAEAHIVELFAASVSPRCHAILALRTGP